MDEILDRIKTIMENEDVSPSALADQIGISRPLLSHVMSGRNKPSLQLVLKILENFPSYSADWLLLGQSTKPRELVKTDPEKKAPPAQEMEAKQDPQNEQMQPATSAPSQVSNAAETGQIVVLYQDATYRVYKPRD